MCEDYMRAGPEQGDVFQSEHGFVLECPYTTCSGFMNNTHAMPTVSASSTAKGLQAFSPSASAP